jgi:hypothetical protein
MDQPSALNMRLLAHDDLFGHGNMGEGISLQVARDGRRVLWLAHECAPKNFTAVDVTDPRKPKPMLQTELVSDKIRSNSLEVTGDILCVAYQAYQPGDGPCGFELFDISNPDQPKSISMWDASGPWSRGAHQVWFVDGEFVYTASGGPDFRPKDERDDQPFVVVDVRNPAKPVEIARWWLPGTAHDDPEPSPPRHPVFNSGWRCHNTNVYPDHRTRAYLGYIDGGVIILDISDLSDIRMVTQFNPNPPMPGMTHTVLPLFDRELLVVSDESTKDLAADWPKRTWVYDARVETNIVPISTLPLPPVEEFGPRGGRYGSHNVHENRPGPSFRSEEIIIGAYFGGGIRVHDISDPFQPKEIAYYVAEAPKGSRCGNIQNNDIHVDENGIIYAVDRFTGGLYILEMDI